MVIGLWLIHARFLLVWANNGVIVIWSNWLFKPGGEANSIGIKPIHTHTLLEDLTAGKASPRRGTHSPVQVNTPTAHTQARAQVKAYKYAGGAESLFHWSMTAKPPSGTPRSPWQPQRFSGHEDVVNKSGESSLNSARSRACAKWSVFPVNLLFLNPVKLRTLPKSHPQTSHIMQNSKTIMHQCLRVM